MNTNRSKNDTAKILHGISKAALERLANTYEIALDEMGPSDGAQTALDEVRAELEQRHREEAHRATLAATAAANGHKLKDDVDIHWDSKTMTPILDGLELLDNDTLQALRDRLLQTNVSEIMPSTFLAQCVVQVETELLRRGIMPNYQAGPVRLVRLNLPPETFPEQDNADNDS